MKQLVAPSFSASDLFDDCVEEISNAALRSRLVAHKPGIEDVYASYDAHSQTQTWSSLPKARRGHGDDKIVGNLTKAELVSLYNKGMVSSKGAARKKYDQLKLAALDECPYCGGCGELIASEGIGTLDHFLPKARYPAFSILPINLIPACATCNTGMGSKFPTDPNLQPLHPYCDAAHFFEEKWTSLVVSEEIPVVVGFDVAIPDHWDAKDGARVLQHFKDCKLRSRYRKQSASDLSSVIDQRKTAFRGLSPEAFRAGLLSVAWNTKLPINGWKRTLHQGLAASDWFCRFDFAQ
ncbi:hypothetical protein SAMN04488512_112107 [Sulfitobacter litoralis]|uniref:HNH endonuclease n=1 Tax=Sulfitobacter litoralis TaxID=335975 RepID=A0ABY0SIX0_9RHOB|nr:HNH endonuclease signature motif containing protein [Sulfitobacter litoralis]SDP29079.1 hypothetical protein SAMN04488512_112107 [Sulfitobacter litoralis]